MTASISAAHGRLLVRPADPLAGLIEVRGLGIRRLPFEPVAVIGLAGRPRRPEAGASPMPARQRAEIAGIALPRLMVATGTDPLAPRPRPPQSRRWPDHIAVR